MDQSCLRVPEQPTFRFIFDESMVEFVIYGVPDPRLAYTFECEEGLYPVIKQVGSGEIGAINYAYSDFVVMHSSWVKLCERLKVVAKAETNNGTYLLYSPNRKYGFWNNHEAALDWESRNQMTIMSFENINYAIQPALDCILSRIRRSCKSSTTVTHVLNVYCPDIEKYKDYNGNMC